ncbi:MAG: hypothetical protein ACFFFT_06765 [Candidatus Thorarchaeota archaeon]
MTSKPNLEALFQEWNELNINAQKFLGEFDFAKIKEIRAKQKIAEDSIYEILKENAPDDIKELLPDECGEMEVGYESEENRFYFVMFDPEAEDEEEAKLIAITIDVSKNVNLIKDFKME